jgi:hypothetical protein
MGFIAQHIESVASSQGIPDIFATIDSDGIFAVLDFAEGTSDFHPFQVRLKQFLAYGIVNNPEILSCLGY